MPDTSLGLSRCAVVHVATSCSRTANGRTRLRAVAGDVEPGVKPGAGALRTAEPGVVVEARTPDDAATPEGTGAELSTAGAGAFAASGAVPLEHPAAATATTAEAAAGARRRAPLFTSRASHAQRQRPDRPPAGNPTRACRRRPGEHRPPPTSITPRIQLSGRRPGPRRPPQRDLHARGVLSEGERRRFDQIAAQLHEDDDRARLEDNKRWKAPRSKIGRPATHPACLARATLRSADQPGSTG